MPGRPAVLAVSGGLAADSYFFRFFAGVESGSAGVPVFFTPGFFFFFGLFGVLSPIPLPP
jgi:hypothetical protein